LNGRPRVHGRILIAPRTRESTLESAHKGLHPPYLFLSTYAGARMY
jgi:hypothetical protein